MPHVVQVGAVNIANNVDSTQPLITGCTAGNSLALCFSTYLGPIPLTVTESGATWTFQAQGQTTVGAGGDTNGYCYIYRCDNITAGSHNPTINPSGGSAYITAVLIEISGSSNPSSDGTPVQSAGESTSPLTGSITVAAGTLLIAIVTHVGTLRSITPAYDELAEDEDAANDSAMSVQSRGDSAGTPLSAGSYTLGWTLGVGAAQWCTAVAGWVDGGGGPPPAVGKATVFTNHLGGWASGWRR